MSLARHAKKRDTSEGEIVDALRLIGCLVWRIDVPFDLLVSFGGRLYMLECKSGKSKLTPLQELQLAACQRHGAPVAVVRSVSDALAAIGAVR